MDDEGKILDKHNFDQTYPLTSKFPDDSFARHSD